MLNPLTLLLPATLVLAAGAVYVAAAARLCGHRVGWPRARTASFTAGVAVIAAALLISGQAGAAHDPRLHMTGHLLLGMLAPLLIVLGAPLALALRTLRRPARVRLVRVLHHRGVRSVAHPLTALVLSSGALYILYLTPLHARIAHDPLAAAALQIHLLLAGVLFTWAIVGIDPMPRRPSQRMRGAVLLAAIALHTVLSRILAADTERLAAESGMGAGLWAEATDVMWFEGDLVELAVLVVFVVQGMRAGVPAPGRTDASRQQRALRVIARGHRAG